MTKNKTTHNEFRHSREIKKARPKMNQRELKANMQIIPTKNMFITKPKKKKKKEKRTQLTSTRSINITQRDQHAKLSFPPVRIRSRSGYSTEDKKKRKQNMKI